MTRAYLAFTDTGLALARRLADALPGSVDRCGSGGVSLAGWTALQFAQSDALVFVGAVGIAVRAIAPHCRSKASDPAVVVLDECGRFAVPVLSGHLGGANDLARALAAVCGAVPVITTATDAHGIFAVDEWAKHQNCTVLEAAAASIDLKADEAGLLTFCRAHGWPITFYSAEQLRALPGPFTPSPFVQSVTGVDNVCERAAVLASGGCIRIPKQAGGGVTLALALCPYAPDWRWQNG